MSSLNPAATASNSTAANRDTISGGQGLESRYGVAGTIVWRFDETRRRSVGYDYMITTTMKPNHTVARDHCLA